MKEKDRKTGSLEERGREDKGLEGWQESLPSYLPSILSSIPFLPLGNFPTPVQRLSNLERALGFESLWIKRDDLSGPLGGGNKVRKLEYMFAAAHADGSERKRLSQSGRQVLTMFGQQQSMAKPLDSK